MVYRVSADIGGLEFSIEMGKIAKQADGAAFVSYGDTVVLVAACAAKRAQGRAGFFPAYGGLPRKHLCRRKDSGRIFQEGRKTDGKGNSDIPTDRSSAPARFSRKDSANETQIIALGVVGGQGE